MIAVLNTVKTSAQIKTYIACLIRLHNSFSTDEDMFFMLVDIILEECPLNIRLEVESQFYQQTLSHAENEISLPNSQAWELD